MFTVEVEAKKTIYNFQLLVAYYYMSTVSVRSETCPTFPIDPFLLPAHSGEYKRINCEFNEHEVTTPTLGLEPSFGVVIP